MLTVEQRVNRHLIELLNQPESELVPTARLQQDLGADSLDMVEVLTALEKEFHQELRGQEISNADAEKFITLQDLYAYLSRAASALREQTRFTGTRPPHYLAPNAPKACGNCRHLVPDYSHPHTDGRSISQQRGWICANPDLGWFSGWKTEGCCESHERLPDNELKHEQAHG